MIAEVELKKVKTANFKHLIPFSFKEIEGDYLLVSDTGRYAYVSPEQFKGLMEKGVREGTELYDLLLSRQMLFTPKNSDVVASDKFRQQVVVASRRTGLHIMVVTGRCNLSCIYCQAGASPAGQTELDMTPITAKSVILTMFTSPVQTLTLEFQGGEPLLNWETVQFSIEYARELEKQSQRKLFITLVSNFTLMDREKVEYLAKNGVSLCASLDGPAHVHNRNRGKNHARVVENYKLAQEIYADLCPEKLPSLLPTITKHSLPYAKDIVDQYVELNCRGIFIRPLTTLGNSRKAWDDAGISPEEFLPFYDEVMEYIIDLNKKGVTVSETQSTFMLNKILDGKAYGYVDLCSPCGAARGQIAYNYDGKIYPCDEARMLAHCGDDSFCIGEAGQNSYSELLNHPVSQSLAAATILDSLPGCSICAYRPYCGVCPIMHYADTGDIFTNIYFDRRHRILEGMFDRLFKYLKNAEIEAIFRKWTADQPNTY
ncbi:MAG: His-Xaa-Ser system radical SAM maturase HxsB [bacterium]